mmetsp:Transcript_14082/g.28183  ORF Transcript_14082/g.28183 Transcript_14082/m.28183 type:complete len:114 (+) Transcript_14082:4041-4382(+)
MDSKQKKGQGKGVKRRVNEKGERDGPIPEILLADPKRQLEILSFLFASSCSYTHEEETRRTILRTNERASEKRRREEGEHTNKPAATNGRTNAHTRSQSTTTYEEKANEGWEE